MDPILFPGHRKAKSSKHAPPPDTETLDLFGDPPARPAAGASMPPLDEVGEVGVFAPRRAPPPERERSFDATEDAYVSPARRLGETFDPDLDATRLASNTARVLWLLLDGQEHDVEELRALGGAQGERRLRELRDARFGALSISSRRDTGGVWMYRLAEPTNEQLRTAEKALKLPAETFHWGT